MPFRKATTRTTQLNKKLFSCSHVFVRHDGEKLALQKPYKNGPLKVIERSAKYFKINLNGTIDNVFDRLKLADLLDSYTCEPIQTIPLLQAHINLKTYHTHLVNKQIDSEILMHF